MSAPMIELATPYQDLRTEQDYLDTVHAHAQVRLIRVSGNRVLPEPISLAMRLGMWVGVLGGAALIGCVVWGLAAALMIVGGHR